uniref:Uncharacterized protein n=1 Tax=Panagrolaimus sp. PS1159 TaxID=55785 RepID=A0AC35F976_9BILA
MPKLFRTQSGAAKLRNEPATAASTKSPPRRRFSQSPKRSPARNNQQISPNRTKFREPIPIEFDDHSPSPPKVRKMDDESFAASSSSRTTRQGSRQLTFPSERIVDNENDIFMREVEAMQEEETEEDLAAKVNKMIVTQFGGRRKRKASKKNVENESDEDENNAENEDLPLAAYPKRHQGE